MARIGYSYTDTPDSGQAAGLRAFFAANLTTWTVGPAYTFGATTTERVYFTLTSTFNSQEILVVVPNGSNADLSTSLNAAFINTGDVPNTTDLSLAFGFAIDGGYEAQLIAGEDPMDLSFFPAKSTRFRNMEFWFEGQPENVLYAIEDDAKADLHIFTGYTASNQGYGYWGYAEDLVVFDIVPNDPDFTWLGDAVIQFDITQSTAASPRPITQTLQSYHYTGQAEAYLDDDDRSLTTDFLEFLTDTTQPNPETGTFESARLQSLFYESEAGGDEISYLAFIGQYNPNILRLFGDTSATYRRKLNSNTGEVFVHLNEKLLLPWAGNLPNPF